MDELAHLNHIPDSGQPYFHIVNHYPLRVKHKLPEGNAKMVQKLYDKRADGEPKVASEGSLIKPYLTRKKVTSPILVIGPMNTNPLWKLKYVPKSGYCVSIQPTHLLEGIKSPNLSRDRDGGISLRRLTTR